MSKNGNEGAARAPPALNPEQLALVQPWKDFISRGLISELVARWTPGGTNVSISLGAHVPVPEGTGRTELPPGMARQFILDSGLAPQKGKGPKNKETKGQPLPARSLCGDDAEDVDKLEARIKAVAMKLGSSVALGRIGSMQMNMHGSQTFEDWWSKASGDQKVKLVMDEKHWKGLSESSATIILSKLEEMPSPFHGPLPLKSLESDKSKAEGEKKRTQTSEKTKQSTQKAGSSKK